MGAVLGAPITAVAATGPEETSVAAVEQAVDADGSPPADAATTAIREQFRASFTAGAITAPDTDLTAVICDPF